MPHSPPDPDQPILDRAQRYCITCPRMCRFSCPVAHVEARETVTPWGLMSLMRMVAQGAIPLDAEVAEVLSHCTGCRRCQGACQHQNPIPEAVFEGRRLARSAGFGEALSEAPALTLDAAAAGFAPASGEALWIALDERPDAPARAARLARIFQAFGVSVQWLPTPQGLPSTSGYGWLADGDPDRMAAHASALAAAMAPFTTILTDSDTLLAMLSNPRWQRPWVAAGISPGRVIHWSARLADALRPPTAPASPASGALLAAISALGPVAYHDACTLARLPDTPLLDPPRALLRWAFGAEGVVELPDHGEHALCCGQGAGYAAKHPGRAQALSEGLRRDAHRLGVRRLVSASPACAAHLLGAASTLQVLSLDEALTVALDATLDDVLTAPLTAPSGG
jgi:Fe-S oxidoreductase